MSAPDSFIAAQRLETTPCIVDAIASRLSRRAVKESETAALEADLWA